MIDVRVLRAEELSQALEFVWGVFLECTAPWYPPEGVEEFRRFIQYDTVMPQWSRGELIFWGAYEGTELRGVSAMRPNGHIVLLDVALVFQRQGIGRLLYQAMVSFCQSVLHVFRMTVHAAPGAVPVYIRLGFRQIAPEQLENGIRYVPMEQMLPDPCRCAGHAMGQPAPPKQQKVPTGIIIAVIAAAVCLCFWQMFLVYSQFRYSMTETRRILEEQRGPLEQWQDEGYGRQNGDAWQEDTEEEQATGLEAVEPYVEENISYEVTTDQYNDTSVSEQYRINFSVNYPVIKGGEIEALDQINESLKACAMETVDQMYTNPSPDMKEKLLGYSECFLVSYTEYKVTYMTEDLLSVAFEDYYVYGNTNTLVQLRTRTINMKTGEVYELKDIVEMDHDFMADWHERIQDEAFGVRFFEETPLKELKDILENGSEEIETNSVYLVDANGIEPGMSYYHIDEAGEYVEQGWATAPFTVQELSQYKTNSDFWKHIDE